MDLKQIELKKLISESMFIRLANAYAMDHPIEFIEIREVEKGLQVSAIVNVHQSKNKCMFILHEDMRIENQTCTCSWCKKESGCAHIGVVLLFMSKADIKAYPYTYQNEEIIKRNTLYEKMHHDIHRTSLIKQATSSRVLLEEAKEKYEQQLTSKIKKDQFELEMQWNWYGNEYMTFSYRVGTSAQKYVVKSIDDFLFRLQEESTIKYGKKLTLTHRYDAFDSFSQKQIDFLRSLQLYTDDYRGPRLGKEIRINTDTIDLFFDLYKEVEHDHYTLETRERCYRIHATDLGEAYCLRVNDRLPYAFGKQHMYLIENTLGKINMIQFSCSEGGVLFLNTLLEENEMIVLKEDFNNFKKYVLAQSNDQFLFEGIEEDEVLTQEYSISNIYADVDDTQEIVVKVEYRNEEGAIQNGFSESFITNFKQDYVEHFIRSYASVIEVEEGIAHFDSELESTYEFINEGLPSLNEYANVYVSESLKKFGQHHQYKISVGVRLENDLLHIDVDSLDINKEELDDVLKAYRKKKKFYRLKNGEMIFLDANEIHELNAFMDHNHLDMKQLRDGHMQVPTYRMFALDESMNQTSSLEMNRSTHFKQKIEQFYDTESFALNIDQSYLEILRAYQVEGVNWLYALHQYRFNGILADDMGLGKTLQVICLLDSLKQEKQTSLIICPASLVYNWEEEITKFSTRLTSTCIVGTKQERKQKILDCEQFDIAITSYDYIRRDIEEYEGKKFFYVVIDEAQYIKNQNTKNALSVKRLVSEHKIALSGTPIENGLSELWSVFDFLMPQYLFNYHYFNTRFEKEIMKNNDVDMQHLLKRLVSPFILRRNKKEVLKELPDKIEKTLHLQFKEEEGKIYYAHAMQANDELQALAKEESFDKLAILALLTRLRQICCESRILFDNVKFTSSKMDATIELIKELKESNQKVLLFSSFTSVLDLLGQELYREGISYAMLTGKTSKEDRKMLVQKFQNQEVDVFLVSLKAGGTGLNLTAAEAVIHYDPWWNQSVQNQATDRAYRIGQKKNVQVFKLVMKNSIEERIQILQNKKQELADIFVEGNNGSFSTMSKNDILDLFKID